MHRYNQKVGLIGLLLGLIILAIGFVTQHPRPAGSLAWRPSWCRRSPPTITRQVRL
jgi:hypothetical protein